MYVDIFMKVSEREIVDSINLSAIAKPPTSEQQPWKFGKIKRKSLQTYDKNGFQIRILLLINYKTNLNMDSSY